MNAFPTNKRKLFNDPVHGFIRIADDFLFDLIEHPYFQRLRRIAQLGLSNTVYPGANHTRFHHALGAMHLMDRGLSILRQKGVDISEEERLGALVAILLHDVGHGPFSHALEHTVIEASHETISLRIMEALNQEFPGKLTTAIDLFKGTYPRKFLCELISSQLDMDRLDYLRRDSFYTGVSEGAVNTSRLLEMLQVADDHLVVEHKGVYSIEKFLVARKLMYWQVYLHKTVLVAETMIAHILNRAVALGEEAASMVSPTFATFLRRDFHIDSPQFLETFAQFDDHDIWAAVKNWSVYASDPTLKELSSRLINRRLMRVELSDGPVEKSRIDAYRRRAITELQMPAENIHYFVYSGQVSNHVYRSDESPILLLEKDGTILDYSSASELDKSFGAADIQEKYYFIFPKGLL